MGNAQTDTPPFMPRLITHAGRQYFAYWTHAGDLVIAVRALPDGDWERNEIGIEIDVRDGHWTPGVGIGPNGHVFINYNTRNSPIRWRRSESPEDISSFGPEQVGMTGQNESSVTYLEFTRLRDGTLLAGYREGASGIGNWMLNRWDPDAEAWEPLQHPLIDGEEAFNSYMWNLIQSDDGTLHYFFNWRETWDVQTNVDLSYARSTDGGQSWERSDGTGYELPMTFGSTEVVDPIEPGSNFINQGWASYDPRTNEPHVAYYRDDADGNTQVFHAYLDGDEWITEATTDRTTDIDLGGGGVVASPIGRMGIAVGDDGDVHILTRDFEHGSWPLLIEKLDGEWQTSVLYKRNVTWSDVHIDPARWRDDRVLSFVDHQQNVGDVPWSVRSLLGITDVDPETLNRSRRSIDLSSEADEMTTGLSTELVESTTTAADSFEDTNTALAFTETTVPGTPAYVRATLEVDPDSAGSLEARIKLQGEDGTTTGESAAADANGITTPWTAVPQGFRAGFANVQIRTVDGEAATATGGILEVAYPDPVGFAETVAPRGSSGAANRPLSQMCPVDSTGLQVDAPVRIESGAFENTPTTLDIVRSTPATPLFARVTARISPTGGLDLEDSSWIWYPNDDPAWDWNDLDAEGDRYFRTTVDLEAEPDDARLVFTADNLATVYVNGEEVGRSDDGFDGEPRYSWEHAPILDVTAALEAGENTIAIEVERFGHYAGLIGRLEVGTADGTVTVNTDENWRVASEALEGWVDPGFDDSSWVDAAELGEYGMGPWGTDVAADDDRDAAIRLALTDESGATTETGDPITVSTEADVIRTTGWQPIDPAFNGGTATLQATNARLTAATLELAIRNEI
ncbi:BNR-4 repeat-containing protein [Natrarchaeobius sp. A-rgal3]|uniref:BNR-4 repeat-containing protein n=1 Tax=Natrarchaeobius versutus TaxID=1679078 RepID=UPI00350F7E63